MGDHFGENSSVILEKFGKIRLSDFNDVGHMLIKVLPCLWSIEL